tara:strand:- start:203 stop:1039 length:837 start_codon:yes stop_codon:yes gene_type:complete
MEMQQEKSQSKSAKTFSSEFDRIFQKLKDNENFAFSRFSDGEVYILKGEKLVLADDHYITGDRSGGGVYTKEEHKSFDPDKDSFFQEKLVEALQHRQENYFKGLTGVADEDIAGKDAFQFQLDICGEGDDEHLTYSNLFINNNYPRFMQEMLPVICEKEIVVVANEAANFDELPLKIIKNFEVGSNCIINDYHLVEEVKNWIASNHIEDTIFLFSASTLSNYIIHECFKEHSNNTYLDIGSCLNPWMGLEGWKHSRAYLQHWILKMPNKYGTQVDTWI